MISAKTFNQLEILCRNVRNNNEYFGGMQVILAGDFYQLPPVANELIGDPGNHCFKLSWFNNCFPHKVKLHIIHRQSDTTLIKSLKNILYQDKNFHQKPKQLLNMFFLSLLEHQLKMICICLNKGL